MANERNMYGCLPCPKCGSVYRAGYIQGAKRTQQCDDCGFIEPFDEHLDREFPDISRGIGLTPPTPVLPSEVQE